MLSLNFVRTLEYDQHIKYIFTPSQELKFLHREVSTDFFRLPTDSLMHCFRYYILYKMKRENSSPYIVAIIVTNVLVKIVYLCL